MKRGMCAAAMLIAAACAARAGDAPASQPYRIQTFAGNASAGEGASARGAALSQPEGLARGNSGDIYVADADDHRVRKIDPDGSIRTHAGGGVAGFAGDGGPASKALLNAPYGLAADRDGNLYIADLGNGRVRRIDGENVITTVAGGGTVTPPADAEIDATEARLLAPRNVAVAPDGSLILSDFEGHRVYRLGSNGKLSVLAGTGENGSSLDGTPGPLADLSFPAGLAVGANGTIYIAESGNRRVRALIGGRLWTVGARDQAGWGEVPFRPTGLAADGIGNLYIGNASGDQALRVSPDGQMAAMPFAARDFAPAADGLTTIVSSGGTVQEHDLRTSESRLIAGGGDFATAGNGGPAVAARLRGPYAIARAGGSIYVAEIGNHRVRVIDASGQIQDYAGTGEPALLGEPAGLALGTDGTLYIADRTNHVILRKRIDGELERFAGTGGKGFSDASPGLVAQFDSPHALAFDRDGSLYVADTGNNRIRKITPWGHVTTFAGGGENTSDDTTAATRVRLSEPRGLAFDAEGNLWVAETGSGRIRRISPEGEISAPFTMRFQAPRAIAFREDGAMLIAESGGHIIATVTPSGKYSKLAGTGKRGFGSEGSAATSAALANPMDVLPLPDGSVLVADFGNNRIRRLFVPEKVEPGTLSVLHGASMKAEPVAATQLVILRGSGFPEAPAVWFGGVRGPVLEASSTEITALVPQGVKDGEIAVEVREDETVHASGTTEVVESAPGLLTNSAGTAAAVNADGSENGADHPASRGTFITLYATGFTEDALDIEVNMDYYTAYVASVLPALRRPGVMELRVRIPNFVTPGEVPVVLRVGGAKSAGGIAVFVN